MAPKKSPLKRSPTKQSPAKSKIRTLQEARESEERKAPTTRSTRQQTPKGVIEKELPSKDKVPEKELPATFTDRHGRGKTVGHNAAHLLSKEGQARAAEKEAARAAAKAAAAKEDATAEAPRRGRPRKQPDAVTTEPAPPRRRSPRKKLIADSPPPEMRLDPFPPQKPPMLVSNKPAIRNRYGEKVIARPDPEVWLQQAINFLSDEGPENCKDFHSQFQKLQDEFRANRPFPDATDREEVERLCSRLDSMIRVHRARIEEGSEEWFLKNTFPNMLPGKLAQSERAGDYRWKEHNQGIQFGAPKYPKMQIILKEQAIAKAKEAQAAAFAAAEAAKADAAGKSKADKGKKKAVARDDDDDDDDESMDDGLDTLPRDDVWHRKEARRFPFGETAATEKAMSREIHKDLARGAKERSRRQEKGWLAPLFRAGREFFASGQTEYSENGPSPWALPEVPEHVKESTLREYGLPGQGKGRKRVMVERSVSPQKKGKRARVV